MASSWKRSFGNVRSFVGNCMGGLKGGSNLASWVVAGTLAYFLWVKPSQDLRREQEERAASAASSDPYRYVEKRKPIPDPQENGLIHGNKSRTYKSEDRILLAVGQSVSWFDKSSRGNSWVNLYPTGLRAAAAAMLDSEITRICGIEE